MKENGKEVILSEDVQENGKKVILSEDVQEKGSKEFNDKLVKIKEKVVRFKDMENEYARLHVEVRDLADDFVKQFKANKQELGKIVS
jgi:DNA primase large subunit